MQTHAIARPLKADKNRIMLERESFTIRALRLVARLDSHCRDEGLHQYLKEQDTWNPEYASDVKLLMGEVFEIMRLQNFATEKGLEVEA